MGCQMLLFRLLMGLSILVVPCNRELTRSPFLPSFLTRRRPFTIAFHLRYLVARFHSAARQHPPLPLPSRQQRLHRRRSRRCLRIHQGNMGHARLPDLLRLDVDPPVVGGNDDLSIHGRGQAKGRRYAAVEVRIIGLVECGVCVDLVEAS